MPDEHCKECYECSDKFNTFRRRHHCRVCGQIFCYRCCGQEVAGKVIGFSGKIDIVILVWYKYLDYKAGSYHIVLPVRLGF